ncbi:Stromal cell-derived factor 2 isoform 2 [Schistosoma japonicum]|uniref:Stromal cell-derived factor 2 isoform 2 n=2 Tax=Schistosoma japonicum TaxID=6182 RepID=B3GUY9_SCHJA|nr:Stromal cell-derived factor 2 isoform 2 [Schistosoma japonicum]TNN07281.1 Stromal cell-derived factor 2 isoform 2 [Schistosoma japonicum]TNN07282.1 Stromal cell-derived factor 2 isoform 2 [Schistosoma japonicum]
MFSLIVPVLLLVFTAESHSQQSIVTCGSVLKLVNTDFNARLHSHEVQYGSGSGQQSVTAISDEMDTNSYWQIIERNGSPQCNRGRVIKCGQKIRLMHLATRKNLHSHHFQSPLSSNFEVSAFGDDGVGDEGDDWQVICDGAYWKQSSNIRLKHISTEGYLHLSGKRYSRPISGQYEVSSTPKLTNAITWTAAEGVYIEPVYSENKSSTSTYVHDEF